MAQQRDFEDMPSQEWPEPLNDLKVAVARAWTAFYTLEYILAAGKDQGPFDATRSNLIELAGRAYALLRDLRAEGMRQLAEWEESQAAPKTAGIFACAQCGDGTFSALETGELPACTNCGRTDEVYQVAGGIPVKEAESQNQDIEEKESRRKQIANWNAVADGVQPPYPSEY